MFACFAFNLAQLHAYGTYLHALIWVENINVYIVCGHACGHTATCIPCKVYVQLSKYAF